MRDGARIAAAIEVLTLVETAKLPVKDALRDWSRGKRFAGSGDRAWISGLVLDALRRRASSAWALEAETPRALALGALRFAWSMSSDQIAAAFEGDDHAPEPLTAREQDGLSRDLGTAPQHVQADIPDWLEPSLTRLFGGDLVAEGRAMAERAPVDLRVNTLKTAQDKALAAMAGKVEAQASGLLREAVRIPAGDPRAKAPPADKIPAYGKGWVEVQDLGSQIAALAAGDVAGRQVLDYCAGAGGKTLALAALMENTGQLYAWDYDWRRLRAIFPRLDRAGARNVQVKDGPREDALGGLEGKMDLVFADAPCSGSGTWRRRPDTKWRLSEKALANRLAQQDEVLDGAAAFVKPGGRLVYVTCSVIPEENEDRIAAFLEREPGFAPVEAIEAMRDTGLLTEEGEIAVGACETRFGAVQLTPARTGTDGFYICVLEKAAG